MPKNIRNFWMVGKVDGTKNPSLKGCGPRAKDGGFNLDIGMRHRGEVSNDCVTVTGIERQGRLELSVYITVDGKKETVRIIKQR